MSEIFFGPFPVFYAKLIQNTNIAAPMSGLKLEQNFWRQWKRGSDPNPKMRKLEWNWWLGILLHKGFTSYPDHHPNSQWNVMSQEIEGLQYSQTFNKDHFDQRPLCYLQD